MRRLDEAREARMLRGTGARGAVRERVRASDAPDGASEGDVFTRCCCIHTVSSDISTVKWNTNTCPSEVFDGIREYVFRY